MAGATFGDVGVSLFVASATFGYVRAFLFVAGAAFGDVGVSLFVAGTALGEVRVGSRNAKCCFLIAKCVSKARKMTSANGRVRDDQFMLGSFSDHSRIIRLCN